MARQIDGYEYLGDIDVRYGGKWISAAKPEYRYSGNVGHVIEVIDSDNFENGKALVIAQDAHISADISTWRAALKCSGIKVSDMRDMDATWRRALLIDALHAYMGGDACWDMSRGQHEVWVDGDDEDAIMAAVESFAR